MIIMAVVEIINNTTKYDNTDVVDVNSNLITFKVAIEYFNLFCEDIK